MVVDVTVDATKTLNNLVVLNKRVLNTIRESATQAADETQFDVWTNLSKKASHTTGKYMSAVKFSSLNLPERNRLTPVAELFVDSSIAPYADIIEYGWDKVGNSDHLLVKGEDIREWWIAVRGVEPPAYVNLTPNKSRGIGYHVFRSAIPYAKEKYYRIALEKINEVTK